MNVTMSFMVINAENIVTWWILAFSMSGGNLNLHTVHPLRVLHNTHAECNLTLESNIIYTNHAMLIIILRYRNKRYTNPTSRDVSQINRRPVPADKTRSFPRDSFPLPSAENLSDMAYPHYIELLFPRGIVRQNN